MYWGVNTIPTLKYRFGSLAHTQIVVSSKLSRQRSEQDCAARLYSTFIAITKNLVSDTFSKKLEKPSKFPTPS